jgi:hypothetical protein
VIAKSTSVQGSVSSRSRSNRQGAIDGADLTLTPRSVRCAQTCWATSTALLTGHVFEWIDLSHLASSGRRVR